MKGKRVTILCTTSDQPGSTGAAQRAGKSLKASQSASSLKSPSQADKRREQIKKEIERLREKNFDEARLLSAKATYEQIENARTNVTQRKRG